MAFRLLPATKLKKYYQEQIRGRAKLLVNTLNCFQIWYLFASLEGCGKDEGAGQFFVGNPKNHLFHCSICIHSFCCTGLIFESVRVLMHELIFKTDRLKLSEPLSVSL